jgi:hypothetical protein
MGLCRLDRLSRKHNSDICPSGSLAICFSSMLKNHETESFLILAGRRWGGAAELDVIF